MGTDAAPIVHRLDHVVVALDGAATAHAFCADVLGLPVAWPFEDYGGFASGGIGLGNLSLELCQPGQFLRASLPARIGGLAFEPATFVDDRLSRALDARGIAHSEPAPTPGWTNMWLPSFFGTVRTFFCDYHIPDVRDASIRAQALDGLGGGELEVVGALRVTIGCADLASSAARWAGLFAPKEAVGGDWRFTDGADVRLVHAGVDEVVDLALKVRRADAAAALAALRAGDDPFHGLSLSLEVS